MCTPSEAGIGHSFPHLVYQQQLLGVSGRRSPKIFQGLSAVGALVSSMAARMMLRSEAARPARF